MCGRRSRYGPEAQPSKQPGQETTTNFKEITSIELYLDGKKLSPTFRLHRRDTIRVTITGSRRFLASLVTDIVLPRKEKFRTVERWPATRKLSHLVNIAQDGVYAVAVESSGMSAFWVEVRVEEELKPGFAFFPP